MGDTAGLKVFGERVAGWFTKALREGKLRSSWAVPNAAYERACLAYLDHCLDDPAYRAALSDLVEEIAPAGAIKGLAQALLRCTSPGAPDTYQGTELWDFSLVDPDNRRPVDFALRQEMLRQTSPETALADWRTGAVKQMVIGRALNLRRARPDVFAQGAYAPLRVEGRRKEAVIAFARRTATDTVIAAAVIASPAGLAQGLPLPDLAWWGDTVVQLEADPEIHFRDHLSDQGRTAGAVPAARLFERLPVALLALEPRG